MKVFVDFDGTVAREDVGDAFFREFGGEVCARHLREERTGAISAKECFRRATAAIGTLDLTEARQFLRDQEIDPSFRGFVEFCRKRFIELRIVSDGFDYTINEILGSSGVAGLEVFSNCFEMRADNHARVHVVPVFPHDDAECQRCACCKRNIMLTRSGDDDVIAFVGGGNAGRCPAQYADIVFAKDLLQTYCQQQNISYFVYESFEDVSRRLEELLAKRRLHVRRGAALRRRETFVAES